jgi:hypothetical protein
MKSDSQNSISKRIYTPTCKLLFRGALRPHHAFKRVEGENGCHFVKTVESSDDYTRCQNIAVMAESWDLPSSENDLNKNDGN